MQRLLSAFVCLISWMLVAADAVAQGAPAERWVRIAEATIEAAETEKRIPLLSNGRFTAVRVRAGRGDAVLSRVVVLYGNGQVHYEERDITLKAGERTRPIDPRIEDRELEAVTLAFGPTARSGPITLEVWGRLHSTSQVQSTDVGYGRPLIIRGLSGIRIPSGARGSSRTRGPSRARGAGSAGGDGISSRSPPVAISQPRSDEALADLLEKLRAGKAKPRSLGMPGDTGPVAASPTSAEVPGDTSTAAPKGRISLEQLEVTRVAIEKRQQEVEGTIILLSKRATSEKGSSGTPPAGAPAPEAVAAEKHAEGLEQLKALREEAEELKAARRRVEEMLAVAVKASPGAGSRGAEGPAATVRPDGKSPAAGNIFCIDECKEVPVLYGTSRKRETDRASTAVALASFGGTPGDALLLGRAVVTVPVKNREAGQITTPEWDFYVGRVSFRREDESRDFTLKRIEVMPEAGFRAAIRARMDGAKTFKNRAFVFVHGYNISFDDALLRTAQIAHDLEFDGAPFMFSWPARGGMWSYDSDQQRVLGARDHLRAFLSIVASEPGIDEVHLVAHSMGARLLMEVLRDFSNASESSADTLSRFREVIVAAPDISKENFRDIAQRFLSGDEKRKLTLYASSNDRALLASDTLKRGDPPAGFVSRSGPTIVRGVETIDVSKASTDFFSLNHTTFADRAHILKDLRLLMETKVHPPHVRFPVYDEVSAAIGKYWRYSR